MEEIYITIAGAGFRYGTEFLEKGMIVKLVKEINIGIVGTISEL